MTPQRFADTYEGYEDSQRYQQMTVKYMPDPQTEPEQKPLQNLLRKTQRLVNMAGADCLKDSLGQLTDSQTLRNLVAKVRLQAAKAGVFEEVSPELVRDSSQLENLVTQARINSSNGKKKRNSALSMESLASKAREALASLNASSETSAS